MRILVTGSREWTDEWELQKALLKAASRAGFDEPIIIVHGDCPTGADFWAHKVALHYEWTPEPHPADWDAYGKAAGPCRNQLMVNLGADVCLAFFQPGAANRGTSDCAARAEKAGIPVKRYPEGGTRESSGAGPDSPPASESRVPGPGGEYQAVENRPDDSWRIEHLVPF